MHLSNSEPPMAAETNAGFRRLTLDAQPLKALGSFYGELFGLDASLSGDSLAITAGGTVLEFQKPAKPDEKPRYHFAFNIPENKLERALEWLRRRTPVVKRRGTEVFEFASWNARAIYFLDPAGNIGEFIARHDLRNAADGPFTPKDILYASEFGVVVDDVSDAVSKIGTGLAMRPYRSPGEDFAAVGDEYGLLIVVRNGRSWFATKGLQARPHRAVALLVRAERGRQVALGGSLIQTV